MKKHSITVYAAIAANLAIAITKFIVAIITGSGALFSEGIHSVVDTGDGLLLLLGMRLSRRPPTSRHPYGHGLESYFWSMVVAMVIFGMGGGLSIYQGILHLIHPHEPAFSVWAYGVLAVAFLFEGVSWAIAMRSFRRANNDLSIWKAIRASKDPTTFTIVLEDSAALIGIVVAAIGITFAHVLHAPAFDAMASIVIGLLLCGVAAILGRETRSLVVGESAPAAVVDSIQRIALEHPGVVDAHAPRTMQLGPEQIHVDIDVRVDPDHDAVATVREIEANVRREHPHVQHVGVRFSLRSR